MKKLNPILADPKVSFHRIRDPKRLKEFAEDPHIGVHTSGTWNIAAAYAMGAWRQNSQNGYPVVITLDVTGLDALPDVDAMLKAKEELYSYTRSEALRSLQSEDDLWQIADQWSEFEYERSSTPEQVIFAESQDHLNPFAAILNIYDGEEADRIAWKWAKGGTLPDQVLIHLVDQRRYLNDFYEDRVVKIETFRPWSEEIIDSYWDEPTREEEQLKAAGYHVIITEDILDSGADFSSEKVTLYTRPGPEPVETQYHGTVSFMAQMALPDIELPDPEGNYWNIED
ncbi:MAG: hypothetical protein Q8S00_32465 [Deltaproteobacteria bacterium]|nr:hypothetical protein [Deltaproteobacteria bacterium]